MNLFGQFNRVGVSLLIASHDLSLIAPLQHRVLTLHHGQLADDQTQRERP
jgi:cell division transport system ATP-binding protein